MKNNDTIDFRTESGSSYRLTIDPRTDNSLNTRLYDVTRILEGERSHFAAAVDTTTLELGKNALLFMPAPDPLDSRYVATTPLTYLRKRSR